MSTASRDNAFTRPKATMMRQEGALSLGWVLFYLGSALSISYLYYRNPGFWELMRRARYWMQWVRAMF